jgi:hypothetical protein
VETFLLLSGFDQKRYGAQVGWSCIIATENTEIWNLHPVHRPIRFGGFSQAQTNLLLKPVSRERFRSGRGHRDVAGLRFEFRVFRVFRGYYS